ncbi:hypothetical protein GCK72_001287 [Caenorhabditis remanei]|uniref:Uncharacterized protein n=1 Tax=Caenorhabditis remanei TaxID=31234 RepID=A0A6A5HMK9_CAERE|nr:hypothetical protein GCK72_001287 [Caenorhabditis remanei]KAF1769470.1 hypothetical protein GCK72_001287 [Caenorhabditis remanei]
MMTENVRNYRDKVIEVHFEKHEEMSLDLTIDRLSSKPSIVESRSTAFNLRERSFLVDDLGARFRVWRSSSRGRLRRLGDSR